jgi:OmpA-OmpF porin, OOP family
MNAEAGDHFHKMRCNWQRWLWGLIPLLLLAWAAITVERGRIEQDLTERANRALAESGSKWASVALHGRDIQLTGRALQDDEPPKAEETLRKIWGVRDVENRAILPPKVEPFVWAARRRGNRIRLMGYVPDRLTRQTVIGLTRAAMPGLDVVDRMNTARGVPPPDTWLSGLAFALKQLSSLRQGDVRIEDLTLTIIGEAEDPASFKSLNAAIKSNLPKGIKIGMAQIAAPVISPFTWMAQLAGGQLVLAGHVAGGDGARATFVTAVKAALPGFKVIDRMEQAEGAPTGWANAAVGIMRELAKLDNGTVEMKDAAFQVGGVAADEAQAQGVRAALRAALPSGFKLTDQIRVREPAKAPEPPPTPPAPPKQTEAPPAVVPEPAPKAAAPAPAGPPPVEPKQAAPSQPPAPAEPAPKTAAAPPPATPPPPPAPSQAAPVPAPTPPALPAEPPAKLAAPAQPPAEPAPATPAQPSEPPAKTAAAPPVAPPQPKAVTACQDNLNSIASGGHILFATDSATLDNASFETLDRLAVAAKTCPGMRIAIEGHTDAEGPSDYNQRLSVRRAQAVVAYLVKAGADRRQLEAVGFGVSRPAAPNDTPENMARNRRIEFSVRQQ